MGGYLYFITLEDYTLQYIYIYKVVNQSSPYIITYKVEIMGEYILIN